MNFKFILVVSGAVIAVVAWSVAAGYRLGQEEVAEATKGPLWIMPESLSLGSVAAQERFAWNVTVVNRNSQPVEVKDLRASCSCTTLEPKQFVVRPGGQQLIKLEVDLFSATQGNRPNESGERPFRVLLLPSIKGYPPFKGWELKGSVHYLYRCMPESIEFGTIVKGNAFPEHRLDVRCDRPLASFNANADPLLRATTEGGNTNFQVKVSLAGEQPLGQFTRRIVLHGRDVAGKTLPDMPVQVRGVIVNDVMSTPPTLLFSLTDDAVNEEELLIESRTSRTFRVLDSTCDSTHFEIIAASSSSRLSDRHKVRVKCLTTSAVPGSTITFQIAPEDVASGKYEVVVPVVVIDARRPGDRAP